VDLSAPSAGLTINDGSGDGGIVDDDAPTVMDLQVSKLDSADPVTAGSGAGNLVYIVTVTNAGPSDATGVTISEDLTLPAGVTRVSVIASAGRFVDTTVPDGTWNLDLASGASETLTVTLTAGAATAAGTDVISNTAVVTSANETLINTGDDSASEATSVETVPEMDISGNGVSIADGDATPSTLDDTDFGNVNVASGTNANTFTVTNQGTVALNLTGGPPRVTIGGTHAAGFTLTTDATTPVASGGGTTTFTITFNPSAVGLRTATVSIANNDSDENPYDFSILGTGTAPEMNLKQSTTDIADGGSYDYGSKVSGSDTDVVFTIENTGTADLTLTTPLTLGGADAGEYSIQSQPTSPITASGTTTFTVRFSPTSAGAKTATIAIANNDSDENPYDLTLNGTGLVYVMISGHIKYSNDDPVEDVDIKFSNDGGTVTTDATGYYKRFITEGWSGTATPTKTDHSFDPINYSYSSVMTNQYHDDYVAKRNSLHISGHIRDSDNNGIEGFEVVFSNGGATVTTNATGHYSTSVAYGWNGTATPTKDGWICAPLNYTYPTVTTDQTNQDYVGTNLTLAVNEHMSSLPTEFTVLPAYPNPFNPSTTIRYGLDTDSHVTVEIYDISGKLISTLVNTEQSLGWYSIVWNGTNNQSTQVPACIYICKITSGNEVKTTKLMLLK
jgi:uncharacterized repeat protein (TIGR01451 family)